MNLICPKDSSLLEFQKENKVYYCSVCDSKYPVVDGVVVFMDRKHDLYEREELTSLAINYTPAGDSFIQKLPLWLTKNGYPWYVSKFVPSYSTILELGCGGGVNFFAKFYKTVGLDYSHTALKNMAGKYVHCLQADALKIPLEDESVDAVVSSYFWEHISPGLKPPLLKECRRVLKPEGKIVFLYDLENENPLIDKLKKKDNALYRELFLERDGHIGYQTYEENKKIFEDGGFVSLKHIGLERTFLQSPSVYDKTKNAGGLTGLISKAGLLLNRSVLFYIFNLVIKVNDSTISKLFPLNHSRIMVSVLKRND